MMGASKDNFDKSVLHHHCSSARVPTAEDIAHLPPQGKGPVNASENKRIVCIGIKQLGLVSRNMYVL